MNIASWEADHVRRYGDHRGLVVGQREWTNIRLYDQACRLAAALIARGVEPGDRVALALPNDRELFVACSAAWLCGGVAVVLGEGPTTELAPLLGNCDPAVFIAADRRIADTVGKTVHRIAVGFTPASADVSSFDALIAAHEPIAEPVPRAEGDAAQLCYTSGATGRPKAAIYTHGGIEEFWRARALASGGAATNGVLLLAVPPTAFGARFIGMRVTADTRYVLLQRFDPERVLEAIERHRVTEIPLVPTMVEQLVACRLARPYDCSSLKTINISGSHVPAALVTRLRERVRALIPAAQRGRTGGQAADEAHELAVIVHYGMTETGGGFACTDAGGDGVVGPVSPSADVRIVAPNGEGLPRGEIGEIVVRTPYAAAGYWRDAEATAAVFRGGYVHTGDLGRFNGTDELCVLGRAKDLIIQAGQNIFPEEIARVIRALDGVAECAVIGLPDDLLGEVAVACVVLASGCGITERGIRSHCRRQLGPRKQPSRIVLVDALPKTRNGKVRSSQLKEAIITRTGRDRGTLALQLAANRTECVNLLRATIAAALRDVLADDADLSPVDSAATFGDLGVDSIGMVGIASLLGERLGRRLSATLLYSYPTIAALSEHLSRCWDDTGEVAASRPATRERVLSGTAPVAIVGIGCRLPGGVQGPDDFWQLLVDGRDAVRPAQLRGAIGTRRSAAFLDDVEQFDAPFFRLAAEAPEIDPRHRLLLEVAWEALEDAGENPLELCAKTTGVFFGIYGERYVSPSHLGVAPGMAVARLCQFLDLVGPVLSVDTTCSSSLVALHLAAQSLLRGECDVAIVGGANLLLPSAVDGTLDVLSPDGRSKAFDDSADGFGQGEGCVLVVLKRMAEAADSGARVYATVRGTAINHDGRSSSLTAPNARAQENVIRLALERAETAAESVQYVEAHGTGTPLGDPIEMEGLARVFGQERDTVLEIGSVKTNIGHLEAAAGIAGVVKAALAVFHRELPASLHFSTPNRHVPWSEIPIRVRTQCGRWPQPDAPLLAGVSSFGMSGTNAHAIIGEAPSSIAAETYHGEAQKTPLLLTISAKTPEALREYANRYVVALERETAGSERDIAYTTNCRRAHFAHRLAVVGASRAEWTDELRRYLAGTLSGVAGGTSEAPAKLVMVFPGQGSQWWGMALRLLTEEPVFRQAVEECAAYVDRHVTWRLLEELGRDATTSRLARTEIAQPALFALQVGLDRLWRSWGVEPAAVVGHSLGEVAAARAAGALPLDVATRLVCERGRIMQRAAGRGMMAAAAMSLARAEELVAEYSDRLEVAANNGPRSVTLTGDAGAVTEAVEVLTARGVRSKLLAVDCPFHSRALDSLAGDLKGALNGLAPSQPMIPMVSTVTGNDAPALDSEYWAVQMSRPVRFYEAITALLDRGCNAFVEIGPDATLLPALAQIIKEKPERRNAIALACQRRETVGRRGMLETLGQLYRAGYAVDWSRQHPNRGRVTPLPKYPWQRESYWYRPRAIAPRKPVGPLVHEWLSSASAPGTRYYESRLDLASGPLDYLVGHRVLGDVWFPASAFLEFAWQAAEHACATRLLALEDVVFERPLVLAAAQEERLQLRIDAAHEGRRRFQIHSRDADGENAVLHAVGIVRAFGSEPADGPTSDLAELRRRCNRHVDPAELSAIFAGLGFEFSEDFMGVSDVWAGDGEVLARLAPTERVRRDADRYGVHPAVLDAAFRIGAAALAHSDGDRASAPANTVAVVCRLGAMLVHAPRVMASWAHARVQQFGRETSSDIALLDDTGRVIAEARGLVTVGAPNDGHDVDRSLYHVEWRSTGVSASPDLKGTWLLVTDRSGVGAQLRGELESCGAHVLTVDPADDYRRLDEQHFGITVHDPEHIKRLLQDMAEGPRLRAVVHLCSLDSSRGEDTTLAELDDACRRSVLSVLHLVKALLGTSSSSVPQLILVTRGAQAADGALSHPAQAPLWGFGATLAREYGDFATKLIDLDPQLSDAGALCAELGQQDSERRVALRGTKRLVPRIRRYRCSDAPGVPRALRVGEEGYELAIEEPGKLNSLHLRRVVRRSPNAGEIEIRVRASALNFRDVLIVLGRYPGEQRADLIGGECSGVVERIGEGVETLHVGDEVVLTGRGLVCSFATVPARGVRLKPRTMTFAEAASAPVAFATALFALEQIGRVRAQEWVLVHSAAGGVGLAAVQYCQRAGAQVIATAGSEEKRKALVERGVEHVFNSRDFSWVEGVKRVTGGRGVDVLLNSLPGDAIPRGLEVLAPCGRFVEIGKRDIDAGTNVSLSAFRRNATFSTASLDVLSPERLAALQTDVWNRLESGFFRPLPVETFPIERLSDAFLHMARAKHVGKIVLLASDTVGVREPVLSRLVRDDRTYLITGGLGDLGLIVARRLLKCGARHLVLVGRRPPSEHARGDLVEFRAGGAHVRVEQVDVAECGVLAKLLADISAEMPPLSGIVHCAGICDDAVVQNLDDESFRAVMSPKVQGSWNLHTLTGGLEFFVLFSSVAGVVGNAGQANYAAANAFMDALAAYRTSRGMPAQSIAWGAWRAGMATSMLDPTVRAIDVSRGGDLFERLIQQPITQVLAFEGSIDALCSPGRGVVDRAFISELTGNKEHRAGVQSVGIVERTSHAAPAARDQLFVAEVRKEVGQLAELPADRIGDDDSLGGLGIDSLGAIRLRSRLIERFGVVVSATALGPNTTTMQIASLVRGRSSPDARFSGTDGADVVSLRPHGIAPPVVFVHPVGGGTRCYQAVADALPYRALAIQAPALREGSAASLDTVERMAEHYLSLLSSAGVSPPLFLAGWSFGGLVAFEMARRLRSNGLSVPLVVLIDARLPVFSVAPTLERESGSGAALSASRDPPGYVDSVRRYLMEVAPVPLSDKRWRKLDAVLRECKTNGDGTESRTLIEAAKRVGLLNGMDSDDAGRLFDVFRSNVAAAQRYRPGVYEGQVLSFTAEKTGGRPGSSSAWLTLAPNTRTEPIDADHYSIISPPALDRLLAVLSPRLRERLS